MASKAEEAARRVGDLIDELCAPSQMSLEEYDETLDIIGADIAGREDARRDERKAAEDGD